MKRLPLFGSIDQIRNFLNTNKSSGLKIEIILVKDKYICISEMLWNIRFKNLSKTEKHIVFKLLNFFTGYSISHVKRLAAKWRKGPLIFNPSKQKHKFTRIYSPSDIKLLITTDVDHSCLSAETTVEILKREYEIFRRIEYANISQISPSHIYNIRNRNRQYNSSEAKFFKRTTARNVDIGIRRKPQPNGKPGYVRVDTVHQGDYLGNKGVYHINIVDEVTQYELIATVEQITEKYLRPVMIELLKLFPFVIFEFHADNGSEYINKYTVEILNKLHIKLTKSRSRHSNDNALVESKNGSVIRKMYGKNYIDRKWADKMNEFNRNYVNIYLNYHRPSAFATYEPDKQGKLKKKYKTRKTPYDRLKSLPNSTQYLKPEFSFTELDKIAFAKSDNQFAEEMNKTKRKLFKEISKDDFYKTMKQKQTEKKNPLTWLKQRD
jgi:hypothetical protein